MVAQISALPTPPLRSDGANFSDRADAFLGALPTFRNEANALSTEVNAKAVEAAASALTAVNAPGTNGTSTTSLTIGAGSKTLTTQTGKAWVVGMFVILAQTAAPTNWMHGQITAYNSATGALTMEAVTTSGAGTVAAWTISLAPPNFLGRSAAADVRAGTSDSMAVTPASLLAAMAPVAVADGATITLDLATGINFYLSSGLGGNRTIANPSNMVAGQVFTFRIPQGTGGQSLVWGSKWKFFGGTPTPSTGAGAIDMVSAMVIDANTIHAVYNKSAS